MGILFFSFNRLDYAQNISEYIARMQDLEVRSPTLWQLYEEGHFTVKSNDIPFTAVGVDQTQRFANKVHKGEGGLSGITTSPETLLQYCLTAPILAQLSREMEGLVGVSPSQVQKHHQMFQSKFACQES